MRKKGSGHAFRGRGRERRRKGTWERGALSYIVRGYRRENCFLLSLRGKGKKVASGKKGKNNG